MIQTKLNLFSPVPKLKVFEGFSRIYDRYDGCPTSVAIRDENQNLFYGHLADYTNGHFYYFLLSTNVKELELLVAGRICIKELFKSNVIYLISVDAFTSDVKSCYVVNEKDVKEAIPDDGVTLYRKTDTISFNIWDDYVDVNENVFELSNLGSTYGYVEEYEDISVDDKIAIAELIVNYIEANLNIGDATIESSGEEVLFDNFSHKRREQLVNELNNSGLEYKGKKIDFYSES